MCGNSSPEPTVGIPHVDPGRLAGSPRVLLRRGSRFNPDVYRLTWRGRPVVLKDFTCLPAGPVRAWGRWVLTRQMNLLRAAEGLAGVPRVLALVGSEGLLMELMPGTPLDRLPSGTSPSVEFFGRLRQLVDALHARGICHGDLHRGHVLSDARGFPSIVDFELAMARRPGLRGGASRVLYRLGVQLDVLQVARMKAFDHPLSLTADERERIRRVPWRVRWVLTYKGKWNRV